MRRLRLSTLPALIVVYVDDLLMTGPSNNSMDAVVGILSTKFQLQDLGELHHFLGCRIIVTDPPRSFG